MDLVLIQCVQIQVYMSHLRFMFLKKKYEALPKLELLGKNLENKGFFKFMDFAEKD